MWNLLFIEANEVSLKLIKNYRHVLLSVLWYSKPKPNEVLKIVIDRRITKEKKEDPFLSFF